MTSRLFTILVGLALATGCAVERGDAELVATDSSDSTSGPSSDGTRIGAAGGPQEDEPIIGSVTSDSAGKERFSGGHPQPWAPPPSRVNPPKPEK